MSEPLFQLKIQGLDNNQIEVQVQSSMLISDLKQQIFIQTQIPVDRQRLLFNSKHLKSANSLNFYNILPSSVLQIIANLDQPREEETVSDLIRTALQIFPNTYLSNRRSRENQRRPLDLTEKLETIRQNLNTIDLIAKGSRSFSKYLWVDVKDTVDQWLEAQVVDVRNNQVFIHYNGWPVRWDEWIDLSNQRIQYFRTFTQQSISSPMHSPYPVTPVDSDYCKNLLPFDLNDCFLQTLGMVDKVQVIMNQFSGQNCVPALLDRFGRVLSDLALIIGNSNRTNEENESSSLITNESGVSNGSVLRPPMQIPVMPPPSELVLMTPRAMQDMELHIHAFVAMRDQENELPNV
jgi:hypothetical protein